MATFSLIPDEIGSKADMPRYPGRDREAWRTYWHNSFIYENAEDLDHLIAGLEKAGLYE